MNYILVAFNFDGEIIAKTNLHTDLSFPKVATNLIKNNPSIHTVELRDGSVPSAILTTITNRNGTLTAR